MNCARCDDTGSLSKDLDGELDCAHCDVATERVALEAWARKEGVQYGSETSIWQVYQHGKAAATAGSVK